MRGPEETPQSHFNTNAEIKKGNTKGTYSGRRKIIPDENMKKQKGMKSNKKGG